jgi:N-6 DNA Methylase
MARRSTSQFAYQAIRIEGGLIPADELARLTTLQAPDKTEQTESHYGVPKGLKLRDEIARFWRIAQNLWADLQPLRRREDINAHDATVREFLVPLLRDVLGFTDIAPAATVAAGGHTYNIGHAARGGRLPVVVAAHNQGLDDAADRFGDLNPETNRIRRRSPFMLAQEALNASDSSLWALVSNGLTLRILRDNPSLTRPAYVEIDLEALFSEELYADFTAFWLLAHASRFGKANAEPSDCPWERWRGAGQEAGVRARDRLRDGVAEALRALGTGFLRHPANTALRAALQSHNGVTTLSRQAFFEQLLSLVYRLIFLATVEDRIDSATSQSLVFAPGTPESVRQRYLAGYSLTALRDRAARRSAHDTHHDLWQALAITFEGLAVGQPALGLPALGGLFDATQCPHLAAAQIENRWLLTAVFQLGYFRERTGLTRVNYRDMGPEELGSVYESLLELVPDLQSLGQPTSARLSFVGDDATDASNKGNTRKLTGSYYTPDSLVQELIKSALEPIIADAVRAHPERPVDALLQLTVCDPACGSGHFLLSAARRLAEEVARLRAPGGAATQTDYRHALRDVVSRCIFGVDKNSMAIALAKTALWLEAYTPDRPLSFLDHHLQCGDALLGIIDPQILEGGIPEEAFTALSGDDKATAAALKKKNRADLKSLKDIRAGDLFVRTGLAQEATAVEHLADDSLQGIAAKRDAWARASEHAAGSVLARLADTYVAAFLAPKLPEGERTVPLSGYMWHLSSGEHPKPEIDDAARALCRGHGVFHWWLAFPQVAARGGFSLLLGNPPWERIKLQEEEFFASRSPLVALAQNKAARGDRIELLRQGMLLHTLHPDVEAAEGLTPPNRAEMLLHEEFLATRHGAEAASLYMHASRRYPLTGVGDVNTYALFAETFLQLAAPNGRAGFIVPTGIATDDSTKAYFEHLAIEGHLRSLLCLENEEFVFPSVHHAFRFALLTLSGATSGVQSELVFFARQAEQIHDPRRRFRLTPTEFREINPNTRTCPVFRSERDAELTKKLYRAAPVLIEERPIGADGKPKPEANPWGIRFSTMFHMSSDSGFFKSRPARASEPATLPLYEAKMIHQFDHRWATYIDAPERPDGLDTEDCTDEQKADPDFIVRPRYWVTECQTLTRIAAVPTRVANAWLATHESPKENPVPERTLEFMVASWIAGELFRREAGPFDEDGQWSHRVLAQAYTAAQARLEDRLRGYSTLLRSAGVSGKRVVADYAKWATQDAEVGLNNTELDELATCGQRSGSGSLRRALRDLLDPWMDSRSPRWLMGFRDITGIEKIRTVIATVVPRVGVGHTMPLFQSSRGGRIQAALLGNWGALTFDYLARQKVGGTHLTYGYLKQFPVLPPDQYTQVDLAYIVPRILELTYTATDLKPWADDLGYAGRAFGYDTNRRAQLRAELDAYYARLYRLTRDELRYVLDPADVMGADYPSETFRVLKNSEQRAFGEYRTRRLVLEAWDALAAAGIAAPSTGLAAPAIVYSDLGVIGNDEEAELAGLLFALVSSSVTGISGPDVQTLIANATAAGNASRYLPAPNAARLGELVSALPILGTPAALNRVMPFLQRLESSGAIKRRRQGDELMYSGGTAPLPPDVRARPEHQELAALILALEAKRRAASESDALPGAEGERGSGTR